MATIQPIEGNMLIAQCGGPLGSVRCKPTSSDYAAIFQILKKYNVRYFFYISDKTTYGKTTTPLAIGSGGRFIVQAFLDYATPIIGRLPKIAKLKCTPFQKGE